VHKKIAVLLASYNGIKYIKETKSKELKSTSFISLKKFFPAPPNFEPLGK
jgi:hypothetical protein